MLIKKLVPTLLFALVLGGGNCGPDEPDETPSCDNTTCEAGMHCELEEVYCVTAPCPAEPVCVADAPNTANCVDFDCASGQLCVMHQVQCVTTPCPPLPTCIENVGAQEHCTLPQHCSSNEICDTESYCDSSDTTCQGICVDAITGLPPL
jgi:hypothetical protein